MVTTLAIFLMFLSFNFQQIVEYFTKVFFFSGEFIYPGANFFF